MIPPSQRRLRDARAAGLRPRSPLWSLAVVASLGAMLLGWLGPRAAGWLGVALEHALAGGDVGMPDMGMSVALLVGLLGCAAAVAVIVVDRRETPRSLGVSPELGDPPSWLTPISCVVAIVLLVAWLRPAVAAAARGVDVGDLAIAWQLWSTWIGRALMTLACVAAVLGVIERLVAARRLWHGLHLTRAQAREQARAAGERRR